jgi:hypothetical protein
MLPDKPAARDDVLEELVDDGIVLVDKCAAKVHHLNASAAWIWSKLDGESSRCEVARQLTEYFDIDSSVAIRDLDQLIQDLQVQGLIEGV